MWTGPSALPVPTSITPFVVLLVVNVVVAVKRRQLAAVTVNNDVEDVLPQGPLDVLGLRQNDVGQNESLILLSQSSVTVEGGIAASVSIGIRRCFYHAHIKTMIS